MKFIEFINTGLKGSKFNEYSLSAANATDCFIIKDGSTVGRLDCMRMEFENCENCSSFLLSYIYDLIQTYRKNLGETDERPTTTPKGYPVNLEANLSKWVNENYFISKTFTVYKMLMFARSKALSVAKAHQTTVKPSPTDNIMNVKIHQQRLDEYLQSANIYKISHTINNLCLQVVELYENEFTKYLFE